MQIIVIENVEISGVLFMMRAISLLTRSVYSDVTP